MNKILDAIDDHDKHRLFVSQLNLKSYYILYIIWFIFVYLITWI